MSDELGFTLTVNSREFDVKLANAGKLITMFGRQATGAAQNAKKFDTSLLGIGSSAQNSVIFLGMLNSAVATLKASFVGWQQAILSTAGQLERLQVMLKGMATEADKAGQAQREMNDLLDMARHAPFSLDALSNSYVKLRTTGIEPAKETLQAMTDAVARFGGDDELLKRATIAIQQMAGKGVVSMEELRQQLGEAVPSAMKKMAYSMGVSVGRLAKVVSTGTVEAGSAIKAMMTELQMSNMNAAANLMTTWDGMLSRMKTNAMVLAKTVADAGYMDTMKGVVQEITDLMASNQAEVWAQRFGRAADTIVTYLRETLKWLDNNSAALKSMGETILVVWGISKAFGTLSGIFGMVAGAATKLTTAYAGLKAVVLAGNAAFLTASTTMRTLPALFVGAGTAFKTMMAMMTAHPLVAGLTAIAGAAYVLWEWFGRIEKKARDAAKAIREMPDSMNDMDEKVIRSDIARRDKEIAEAEARLAKKMHLGPGRTTAQKAQRAALQKQIDDMRAERDELQATLELGVSTKAANALSKDLEKADKAAQESITELSNTYEKGAEEIAAAIEALERNSELNPNERKEQQDALRAQQKAAAQEMLDAQLQIQQESLARIHKDQEERRRELADPSISNELKVQLQKELSILLAFEARALESVKMTRQQIDTVRNSMYSGLFSIGGAGTAGEKDTFLTFIKNHADSLTESLASAQAKVKGLGSEEAKFMAQMEAKARDLKLNLKDLKGPQKEEFDRGLAAARAKDKIEADKDARQAAKEAASEAKQAAAELRRNYKEMERAIDAGERMAETVSFAGTTMQKFDKDLAETTEGLRKLIAAAQTSEGQKYISPEKVAEAEAMLKVLQERAAEYRQELQKSSTDQLIEKWAPFSNEIIDQGKKTQAELRKQWNEDADESIRALERMIDANKDNAEVRLLLEDQLNQTLLNRNSAFVNQVGTQAEQLVQVYKEVADQIDEAVGGAFEDLTDQIVDFCETGKFDFGAFGDFIFDELTRIFVRSQIMVPLMDSLGIGKESTTGAGLLGGLSSMWGSLTGGGNGETQSDGGAADAMKDVADAAADTTGALGDLQQKGIMASLAAYGQQIWQWITGATVQSTETTTKIAATSAEASHTVALFGATMALESFSLALAQAGATAAATSAFANGGIMSSAGSLPLKMYANGGIATEPQLALFGEGRHNEAFVPLPDGRSIPVSFTDAPGRGGSGSAGGTGDGGVAINIDVVYQGSEAKEKVDEKGISDKWADVAQRVKVIVLSTLAEEKRNGGMLADA